MMYIVIQPQSYHTTRQISIAYSGLKQMGMHCILFIIKQKLAVASHCSKSFINPLEKHKALALI
jgi:hypothetical protein